VGFDLAKVDLAILTKAALHLFFIQLDEVTQF